MSNIEFNQNYTLGTEDLILASDEWKRRWDIQMKIEKYQPGVSKVHFVLFKTSGQTWLERTTTACQLNIYATSGELLSSPSSMVAPLRLLNANMADWNATGDYEAKKESWNFISGTGESAGLNYYSGGYTRDNGQGYGGAVFRAQPWPQVEYSNIYVDNSTEKSGETIASDLNERYEDIGFIFHFDKENDTLKNTTPGFSFNGTPHAYGVFYIKHNTEGKAKLVFNFNTWINLGVWNDSNVNGTYTLELPDNYSYTSIVGPNSFKTSLDDLTLPVIPAKSVILSWKGAKQGINNPITKYKVKIKTDEGKILKEEEIVYSGESWTSLTFKLDNSLRGKWITWSVKAEGNLSDFNAEEISSKLGFLVNNLPNSPTITKKPEKVPAIGGKLSFSGSAGTDLDSTVQFNIFTGQAFSRQVPKLYYSIGNGTTKYPAGQSPFQIEAPAGSNDITVNFYSYDGLEFSNPTSIIIKRNIRPVLNKLTVQDRELTATLNNTNLPYTIYAQLIAEAQPQESKVFKYNFGFEYDITNTFSNLNRAVFFSQSSKSNCEIKDIRYYIKNFESSINGYYVRFYAEATDGLDTSEKIISKTYYIPPKPNINFICNKLNGQHESKLDGFFSNNISLILDLDQGYTSANIYIGKTMVTGGTLILESDQMIVNIDKIPYDLIAGDQKFIFQLCLYNNNESRYLSEIINSEMTRVRGIITNIINDYDSETRGYKIYTDINKNLSLTITITDSNGNIVSDFENLENYGISEFYNSCSILFGDEVEIQLKLSPENFVYSSEAGAVFFNFSLSDLNYNSIKNQLSLDGVKALPLSFLIKDNFGNYIIASSKTGFYIDCRSEIEVSQEELYFKISNSFGETLIEPGNILKESMYLYFFGTIKTYNSNPKGQIMIKRGNNDWTNYGNVFDFELSQSDATELSPGNPLTYSKNKILIKEIPRIEQKDYTVQFKIKITTNANSKEQILKNATFQVKEHQTGKILITGTNYFKNNANLTLTYDIQNPGVDLENTEVVSKASFIWSSPSGEITKEIPIDNYIPEGTEVNYLGGIYATNIIHELKVQQVDENGDLIPIQPSTFYGKIKVETTYIYIKDGLNFTTTYITESSQVVIYNESPTVSYRKNRLGINTNQVEAWDDAMLVISTSNKDQTKILIVYPELRPSNNEYVISIDAITGAIDGVILDGGSW